MENIDHTTPGYASETSSTDMIYTDKDSQPHIEAQDASLPAHDDTNPSKDVEKAEDGLVCELKTLYEGPKKCICCIDWVDVYPEDMKTAAEDEKQSRRNALLVRMKKNHNDGKPMVLDSIVIQSPFLRAMLGKVFEGYDGITAGLQKLVFKEPFHPFFYRWDRLTEMVQQEKEGEPRAHAQLLYSTLQAELADISDTIKDLLENNVITFKYLWALFAPGTDIYKADEGHHRFYKLVSSDFVDSDKDKYFVLQLKFIDWDGFKFGYASTCVAIPEFKGTKEVTDLPVFPSNYLPAVHELKEIARERGKKFQALSGCHYKAYKGLVAIYKNDKKTERYIDGRIVIDTEASIRFNLIEQIHLQSLHSSSIAPKLDTSETQHNEGLLPPGPPGLLPPMIGMPMGMLPPLLPPVGPYNPSRTALLYQMQSGALRKIQIDELTDDQLILCSPELRGYCLKIKEWVRFYVDNVQEIKWNDKAFENLMLPGDYKKLVLSFVESQVANKDIFDDFIEGKGQGMIMLLAGNPGVGKTLTAEAVADKLQKPLYSISAGELGQDTGSIEHKLNMILEVAAKWEAVLLIDESDVFLEERSTNNLVRNEIVAIFLRMLEYYRGVLFTTTNRQSAIDPAFQSRIHLTIQYPSLDSAARKHIWTQLVKLSRHKSFLTLKDFDKLGRESMNGREIKNAVKTAQLLARKEEVPLNMEHVQTVLRVTRGSGGAFGRKNEETNLSVSIAIIVLSCMFLWYINT